MALPKSSKLHFSYILDGNKVVAWGVNDGYRSHTLSNKYNWRFHARHSELAAIISFPYPPYYLRYCTLVNIRLNKAGQPSMSKPCPSCQRMLEDFQFRNVFYTAKSGELVRL